MNVVNASLKFNGELIPLKLDKIKFLVVHHIEANTASVDDIEAWHKGFGWAGVGYNEYIRKDGTVYICRGDNIGAQCAGYNSCSYGIALEGDYSMNGNVPAEQYMALVKRIKYNLGRFPKNCVVVPHRVLVDTECPGDAFPFAKLLEDVSKNDDVNPSYKNCVDLVSARLGLNSPAYWYKHQDPYVKVLIQKMANHFYTTTNN
jgi:hypothetical protein